VFNIPPGDKIVSIAVKYGNLVDSICLTTVQGRSMKVGGTGGQHYRKLTVPPGKVVIGFYGGTGGHLHNLGVVLADEGEGEGDSSIGAFDSAMYHMEGIESTIGAEGLRTNRLLALCSRLELWQCGLLNSQQHVPGRGRDANVGQLLELLARVRRSNPADTYKRCLTTIASYTSNLLKDQTDKKFQSIKTSNAFFQRTVLSAHGGLALFCFGPACFSLSPGGLTVDSCISRAAISPSFTTAEMRRKISGWLHSYVQFLQGAAEMW
jgi:hypothetical protein